MHVKPEYPALQVAFDFTSWDGAMRIVESVRELAGPSLIVEVGTPLIKAEGVRVVRRMRDIIPRSPVVADMKTMDTAEIEVELAASAGADAAVVSGAAPKETVKLFIDSCRRNDILSYVDSLGVDDVRLIAKKAEGADIIVIHRGIDEESLGRAPTFKEKIDELKPMGFRVAVAGGLNPTLAAEALGLGAHILIVGRDITGSEDPGSRIQEYLHIIAP